MIFLKHRRHYTYELYTSIRLVSTSSFYVLQFLLSERHSISQRQTNTVCDHTGYLTDLTVIARICNILRTKICTREDPMQPVNGPTVKRFANGRIHNGGVGFSLISPYHTVLRRTNSFVWFSG